MTKDKALDLAREIAAQYSKAERFQTWTHDFMMQRLMELVDVSAEAEREKSKHNEEVLMNALWKACGDDEQLVKATIESQGELK
jgi:hypothetical protein